MCGIIAIIKRQSKIQEDEVRPMVRAMIHRGPDSNNIFISNQGNIALGHSRLSIIDLSDSANQPFHSQNGRYVMVYNGEVFNYLVLKKKLEGEFNIQFKNTSDTEVILEAFVQYGPEMVGMLEGMFALAIFDKQEEHLYLFRDRVGKKPLYYFQQGDLFVLGSELKGMLEHAEVKKNLSIDTEAIFRFLHLGYIPEPLSIYREIKKFPSGSWGIVDKSLGLDIRTFWAVEDYATGKKITDLHSAKQGLHSLIKESVRDRLISDVPLGAFLSGGIDSSLVTAIASRLKGEPVKTFTIGFEENKFDERVHGSKVAHHLKTEHHEFKISEQDAIGILDTYIDHFDEPFYDTSAIPMMLVSKFAHEHVKVALTGDGGDELFQGYGSYRWAERLYSLPWRVGRVPVKILLESLGNTRYQRLTHMLGKIQFGGVESHIYSQEQGLFSQSEIKELLVEPNQYDPFDPGVSTTIKKLRPAERQALFDINYYLKDDLLVKVDRASMYYSLECRCPLLDYHVVEYALSLDYSLKRRGGKSKWILREILKEYFPANFFDRPKRGFSIPLAHWMKGELKYLMDDYLSDAVVENVGMIKVTKVRELIQRFKKGENYLYTRIWALILLHKWMIKQ